MEERQKKSAKILKQKVIAVIVRLWGRLKSKHFICSLDSLLKKVTILMN